MATLPLATMGCTLDATGISAPPYEDILANLQFQFRSIFGSDAYVEPDSQDGQLLAIFARAVSDDNGGTIAAYNSFRPGFAQGAGLSSVVKINGLERDTPSNSTVDVTIVGQAGTVITAGFVGPLDGSSQWALPPSVTIPTPAGSIVVTATCTTAGAVAAAPGTITKILTPTLGWQSATNASDATPGQPVENDAVLRRRQTKSTALPAQTRLEAIEARVGAIPGVTRVQPYDNDTDTTDANGIPEHSVSMVVEGGDAFAIAEAILLEKGPGAATYGTTTETPLDAGGVPKAVHFYRPTNVRVDVEVSVHPLIGYTSTIGDNLVQAIADYGAAYDIGADVITTRLYLPANLNGAADSATYEVPLIRVRKHGGSFSTADITILFNELAGIALGDITLLIV